MTNPLKILFLSEHNARRGPLAAALANKIGKGKVLADSAGLQHCIMDADIEQAILSLGLEASPQEMHTVDHFLGEDFDLIIALCDKSSDHVESLSEFKMIKWDEPESHDGDNLHDLKIELADRIRLMLLARKVI